MASKVVYYNEFNSDLNRIKQNFNFIVFIPCFLEFIFFFGFVRRSWPPTLGVVCTDAARAKRGVAGNSIDGEYDCAIYYVTIVAQ